MRKQTGYWRPLLKPHLGFMSEISDFIYRMDIADPYLLRDLRRGPRLVAASDYGGEHETAEVVTYSFLLAEDSSVQPFLTGVSQLRSQGLGPRRMAYKKLGDAVRTRILVPFLLLADAIHGVLFTIAIPKNVNLFGNGVLESERGHLPDFKPAAAGKLLTVCHLISLAMSGLVAPGQDIVWITDQDAIAASPRHLDSLCTVFGHFLNHYLSCDVGNIRVGTTKNDPGDLSVEDLASLPDLAAGSICEALTTESVLPKQTATGKTQLLIGWLCNRQSALAKVNLAIRNTQDQRLAIQLLSPVTAPIVDAS